MGAKKRKRKEKAKAATPAAAPAAPKQPVDDIMTELEAVEAFAKEPVAEKPASAPAPAPAPAPAQDVVDEEDPSAFFAAAESAAKGAGWTAAVADGVDPNAPVRMPFEALPEAAAPKAAAPKAEAAVRKSGASSVDFGLVLPSEASSGATDSSEDNALFELPDVADLERNRRRSGARARSRHWRKRGGCLVHLQ